MNLHRLPLRNTASYVNRAVIANTLRRPSIYVATRQMSTPSKTPAQDPKTKAQSIMDAIPGNSIISKTGILATSAAAAVYAISNELYVINEESILLLTFGGIVALMIKMVAPVYKDFADSRMKKVSDVLNASRIRHVDAVKERIESVSSLKNVSDTTRVLFDVSKETVELEAKAFEEQQKVDLVKQAKSVLDSWVRYEASLRQMQQKQMAETIIKKVQGELSNPKFQDKVLQQSITEVEKLLAELK
ncbi:hypothetical protein KAFR_0E00880 [Kazachstania africana CBS 2517]|uniref:ATP synthase subunit 4 n=1 Tax=Kazachstania africana (strain ATCC 22294 / BCRC 22015 / CBS 2517 / CECT 1963 / NBRC 1671 / NRRL Y-8276) TaxID=1071382 RepID=H2AV42_KAZAF|nr:hypothetical protein KAFR_0E00880 [Kazachstania africana CBS 2517]CCF58242.1 hypothetical protein KAFR_0E00880 [Kazachstania africana CBS 2517]